MTIASPPVFPLPPGLRALEVDPCWVGWCRYDGQKAPLNPHDRNGRFASSIVPTTWGAADECRAYARRKPHWAQGLGIMHSPEFAFCTIDIDGKKLAGPCDPRTRILDEALRACPGYLEFSPSGTGWHKVGICLDRQLRASFPRRVTLCGFIDIFCDFGFCTCTGNLDTRFGNDGYLSDISPLLAWLKAEHEKTNPPTDAILVPSDFQSIPDPRPIEAIMQQLASHRDGERLASYFPGALLADARARNLGLWHPEPNPDKPHAFDWSAAEFHLGVMLMRVTKDYAKALEIFSRSALYRPNPGEKRRSVAAYHQYLVDGFIKTRRTSAAIAARNAEICGPIGTGGPYG